VNASIISSSWVKLIYVEFCEITRAITTKSEHTDHWTKMLRPFALFSGSVPSRHIRSSAGFTITTCVFEFSVHTGPTSSIRRALLDFRPSVHHITFVGPHCSRPAYPRHFAQALLQPARAGPRTLAKRLISISPSSGGGIGSGLSTTAR
jgi:hypothetical protein